MVLVMVKIWYIWGTKNIAMLKSMKKPGDKLKAVMASAQSFPERKKATSEIMAGIKKGTDEYSQEKAYVKKLNAEAEEQRMEDEAEKARGERDFGKDYSNLGIKSLRYRTKDSVTGKESYGIEYRSPDDEIVEKSAPGSDVLKITKRSTGETSTQSIKDRIAKNAAEKAGAGDYKYKQLLQKIGYNPKQLAEHRKTASDAGQISQFDQFKKKYGLKEVGE